MGITELKLNFRSPRQLSQPVKALLRACLANLHLLRRLLVHRLDGGDRLIVEPVDLQSLPVLFKSLRFTPVAKIPTRAR